MEICFIHVGELVENFKSDLKTEIRILEVAKFVSDILVIFMKE